MSHQSCKIGCVNYTCFHKSGHIVIMQIIINYCVFLLALSPKEIREFFAPIITLAEHLLEIYNTKQIKGMKKLPVITVSRFKSCLHLW